MATKRTIRKFEKMGIEAWSKGINAPKLDPRYMKATKGIKPGEGLSMANAWNRGWYSKARIGK